MSRMSRATWFSGLLVGLGVGAAVLAGGGVASAESPGASSAAHGSDSSAGSTGHSRPSPAATTTPRTRKTLSASRVSRPAARLARPAPRPVVSPPPVPALVTAVTTFFEDLHDSLTGAPEARPSPVETATTAYGTIGKWMLGRSGALADWPNQQYPFKTLYQPINVIIVDPTSSTAEESARKLDATLSAAGFPAQPVHSTGYQGLIDGVVYGQQPTGPEQAFSNAHWLLTNDHGRVFGAAPAPDGTGYVWTASFSRERPGFFYVVPTHVYVSFNRARDRLRAALVRAGATDLGLVDMDNELDRRTTTTGDHDGYAIVIELS
ncbi:hypothetical protein [Mycolicibacterium aichiense]|uniref:Uncharacterized protein n=1 Tax=Mycolicibacterium aichiense TaxID=1799 RepID=A0AAD1MCZ8_9MYCO|nr:hypothetical protein [Mycolicibacterium aichiense]MCV7019382.1 hypothetical protein [Mycolicibacterium aichiense]BBX08311.1 hypothetical protein MAIC_31140 [Mycolicibacterium aichiense]STZ82112.1 Uncharacterised protein [Mycolicibacterium aichiense]